MLRCFLFGSQINGNFLFALGYIAELQQECLDDVLTQHNADINNTPDIQLLVNKTIANVTENVCDPVDCNGNGQCIAGSCNCTSGTSAEIRYVT